LRQLLAIFRTDLSLIPVWRAIFRIKTRGF
jgi:hypothetical protein